MSKNVLSDKALIDQFLSGKEEAFEILLNRHKDSIYTSIYMFVKDKEKANDIFQDVFIKIIRTLRGGKYTHKGKFKQWASRIAYNMCVDNFRKKKRRAKVTTSESFDIFDVLESPNKNMEDIMIQDQTNKKVRQLIDRLSPEQREVVILRHYADMSFKEIAGLTRVSINTALGRMRYALINMRKMIEEGEVMFSR